MHETAREPALFVRRLRTLVDDRKATRVLPWLVQRPRRDSGRGLELRWRWRLREARSVVFGFVVGRSARGFQPRPSEHLPKRPRPQRFLACEGRPFERLERRELAQQLRPFPHGQPFLVRLWPRLAGETRNDWRDSENRESLIRGLPNDTARLLAFHLDEPVISHRAQTTPHTRPRTHALAGALRDLDSARPPSLKLADFDEAQEDAAQSSAWGEPAFASRHGPPVFAASLRRTRKSRELS